MPERTYTEHEIAAIFARAAERGPTAPVRDPATGLTLAEVEQAGREAGLDPASVRAAAAELETGYPHPAHSKIALAERWIEVPINMGAWEDLVISLRHRFGTSMDWWTGDTAPLGTAQEWTHTAFSGVRTTVTLSPREGRTLLRVMQEDAGLADDRAMGWLVAAFLTLIPAMLVGALVAETLALGDLAGVAAVLLVLLSGVALGGPWLAARTRSSRTRQAEQVHHIADDLARQLGEDRPRPAAHASGEAPEPRLDLSAHAPSPPEAEAPAERRRTKS